MYLYPQIYTNTNTYSFWIGADNFSSFCIDADIFSSIRVQICIGIQWGFELEFQLVDCIYICIILVIIIIVVVVVVVIVIDLVVVVVVVVVILHHSSRKEEIVSCRLQKQLVAVIVPDYRR